MIQKLLIASVLIFIWSRTAAAQVYTIHGSVSVPSKKPVGSYEVFLNYRDTDQTVAHQFVSETGVFEFSIQREDDYEIVINLEGYRESKTPVRVKGVLYQSVSIILVPDSRSRRQVAEREAFTEYVVKEFQAGLEELDNSHPDRAAFHLENVIRELPDYSDAHLHLGFAYQDLSRRNQAEMEFRKAHEQSPASARPLVALGRFYVKEAEIERELKSTPEAVRLKLEKAREALIEAVMVDEKIATAFYYLGAIDFRMSNFADSEKQLNHALELNPNLHAARILLINVYWSQERWRTVVDSIEQFLMENSTSVYREELEESRLSALKRLQTVQ